MNICKILAGAMVASVMSVAAQAASVVDLFDHPNRSIGSEEYGLRLDRENPDLFFSFEDTSGGSLSQLFWDFGAGSDGIAVMTGQMRESNAADSEVWDLFVVMTGLEDFGSAGWAAADYSGTLSDGTTTIDLDGKGKSLSIGGDDKGMFDFVYALDNTNSEFRVVETATGWVDKLGTSTTNDFLATFGQEGSGTLPSVPLPAAAWLLLGGVGALGAMRARRKV